MNGFLCFLLLLIQTPLPSAPPAPQVRAEPARYILDEKAVILLDGQPCPWPPPANVVITRIVVDGRRIVRLEMETEK